jgi:hypothetical protein
MQARRLLVLLLLPVLALLAVWGWLRLEQLERDRLVDARAVVQERACCAGPGVWRGSLDAMELARRDCPPALETLRWITRGVGEPVEEAKGALLRCKGLDSDWRQLAGPPVRAPSAPVVTPQEAADAGPLAAEVADAGPTVEQPWVAHESREPAAPRTVHPLSCAEVPPDCPGGPCEPFTPQALQALTSREPAHRAAQLRAWLCDAKAAVQAREALSAAAGVLRAALPAIDEAHQQASSWRIPVAAADGGADAAQAQALLCALPWSALQGGEAVLGAVGCQGCERVDESGGDSTGDQELPCALRWAYGPNRLDGPVPLLCALAWAQSGAEFFDAKVPPQLAACLEEVRPADDAGRALAQAVARKVAAQRIEQARAKLPVPAAGWPSLVEASLLLDYQGHDFKPKRGRFSLVAGDAKAQEAQLRARLRPLLSAAAPSAETLPGPPDAGPLLFPEAALQVLALKPPGGAVVRVCDDALDKRASRRGLFWVQEARITALEPAQVQAGFNEEMSGMVEVQPCPILLDVADLDGDGAPELLTLQTEFYGGSGAALKVVTMAGPPVVRHLLHQSSTEAEGEAAAEEESSEEEAPAAASAGDAGK